VLVEGVELGVEGAGEAGAAPGLEDEESPVDEEAGLSADFSDPDLESFESDFESEEESLDLEDESEEESLELESPELELLGA
jgi:hypothetical protein